jgi:glycosyltransferase involved in cell wall biosynthesis
MSALVSIIIPCYNAERWVGEAIRSALKQTYSPVEVIVIDDGSTDRSLDFIKSFKDEIRWETGPNRGGDYARNRGFALSAGKYIQFLDADDYLLPSKIERQMQVLENRRADVVYEDCQVLFENADGSRKWGSLEVSGEHADILEKLLDGWAPPPCTFLFSRLAVEKAGGWNENLTSAQDNDFYIKVALAKTTWSYASGSQSVYRRLSVPTVSTQNARATDENLIRVFRETEANLLRDGCLADRYRRAIARSYLGIGRKHFNSDIAWFYRLRREAQRLWPSIVDECSHPYRLSAKVLGIPATENLRSLKHQGLERLKRPVRTLRNGLRRFERYALPILMYHNVGQRPAKDPFGLTVAPDRFELQMRYLVSHGYRTMWPSDWLALRSEGKPLQERAVLLTFDDGYADMVEYAFPILRRYGLKAAVYVVTRRLGLTNTWDEVNGNPTMRLITGEQICRWAGQGIEFGSHTQTHPHLAALNKQRLTDEIEGSRDDLKCLLGAEVISFAYPYRDGVDSTAIRQKLIRTYPLALTVNVGLNSIETNPYEMRRVPILPDDSLHRFERKLRFEQTIAAQLRGRLPEPIKKAARLSRLVLETAFSNSS